MAITTGLIAYYSLESDISDELGSYDGSSSGITFSTGLINNAAVYDNSADYINLGSSLISAANEFSVSFWVYFDGNPTNDEDLICRGALGHNSSADFVLWRDYTASAYTFKLILNGSGVIDGTYEAPSGEWIHVVLTFSGTANDSAIKLFINGKLDSTAMTSASSANSGSSGEDFIVGANSSLIEDKTLDGQIDEFGVWNRVLTYSEINYLYNNGSGRSYSDISATITAITELYLKIDSTLIDSALTDFPLPIKLDFSHGILSGVGATDYEGFHFTVNDVECYAEVDVWNTTYEEAVIWVKIPSVSSSSDTVIKIENVGDDNTSYVGVTGSTPAQNVWDSNFVAVYLMGQEPSGTGAVLDSTSNGNDANGVGWNGILDSIDDILGNALNFNGSTDYVVIPTSTSLDAIESMTIEAFINFDEIPATGSGDAPIFGLYYSATDRLQIKGTDSDELRVFNDIDNVGTGLSTTTSPLEAGTHYHIATKISSSNWFAYVDTSEVLELTATQDIADLNDGFVIYLGYLVVPDDYLNGKISYVAISNILRSDAWIKATYNALNDNLLSVTEVFSGYLEVTIDSSLIDSDLTNFPVGIKIDSSDSILSGLGSESWKYLHATVDDVECFVEVDIWDMTSEIALIWVRVPLISSSSDTVIKLQITGVNNYSQAITSTTVYDDFTGNDGDSIDSSLWAVDQDPYGTITHAQMTGTVEIQSNQVELSLTSGDTLDRCNIRSLRALQGDFSIDIAIDTNDCRDSGEAFSIQFWSDINNRFFLDKASADVTNYRIRANNGGTWDTLSTYTRPTDGEFSVRFVRSGSTLSVYWDTGSGFVLKDTRTITTGDMWLYFYLIHSATTAIYRINDITINSADGLTGRIGLTGEIPANSVWDMWYRAIYHMSQDPSTSDLSDSTFFANDGTPNGSMTSDDLVDGGFGKAIDFDGSNDYFTIDSVATQMGDKDDIFTFEVFASSDLSARMITTAINSSTGGNVVLFFIESDGSLLIAPFSLTSSVAITADQYFYSVALYNGTQIWKDIDLLEKISPSTKSIALSTNDLYSIGQEWDTATSSDFFSGEISEVRISDIVRSDAWLKATYHVLNDNLLSKEFISDDTPSVETTIYGQISINGKNVNITGVYLVDKGVWVNVEEIYMLNDYAWRQNIKS